MDKLYLDVRKFIAKGHDNDGYLAEQIASAINQPINVVKAALIRLADAEIIGVHKIGGKFYYFKPSAFVARHIVPLFAGTPEWVVETAEGRLCCWCPSEFDARTIAAAMSGG
jgi:hypothetical protein